MNRTPLRPQRRANGWDYFGRTDLKTTCVTLSVLVLAMAADAVATAAEVDVWAAPDGYKIDKFGKKIFTLEPAK